MSNFRKQATKKQDVLRQLWTSHSCLNLKCLNLVCHNPEECLQTQINLLLDVLSALSPTQFQVNLKRVSWTKTIQNPKRNSSSHLVSARKTWQETLGVDKSTVKTLNTLGNIHQPVLREMVKKSKAFCLLHLQTKWWLMGRNLLSWRTQETTSSYLLLPLSVSTNLADRLLCQTTCTTLFHYPSTN